MNRQTKRGLLLLSSSVILGLSGGASAEKSTTVKKWGQFNVECVLSHTLPDDPMMAFGRPGESMVHDFFGNKTANAYTTADSLLANPDNTCTSAIDGSSYWAPQLMDSRSGEIIKPIHMKTYYRNTDTRYPVVAFPKGLQLMIGEHESTTSKPNVSYFCKTDQHNGDYSENPPTSCPLYDGENTQFNLAYVFANCWDGKNLKPPHHGPRNAVHDIDGACPANYPIKIPQLQFNVAYSLPAGTELSTLKLSMNPTMVNGRAEPKWGSLYTAHADFFNGWPEKTINYAVENCLNSGILCDKAIPSFHETVSDDSYTRGGNFSNINFGNEKVMLTQQGTVSLTDQKKTTYFKFKLPDEKSLEATPYTGIALRLHSGNTTSENSHMLYLYQTDTHWDEGSLTQENAPVCGGEHVARIWMGKDGSYRNSEDITPVIKTAWEKDAREVSFCAMTDDANIETIIGSREANLPTYLFFASEQKATAEK